MKSRDNDLMMKFIDGWLTLETGKPVEVNRSDDKLVRMLSCHTNKDLISTSNNQSISHPLLTRWEVNGCMSTIERYTEEEVFIAENIIIQEMGKGKPKPTNITGFLIGKNGMGILREVREGRRPEAAPPIKKSLTPKPEVRPEPSQPMPPEYFQALRSKIKRSN